MTNSNHPKWLDVTKLKSEAGKEAEQQGLLHVNLPVNSHSVVATYDCPQCHLQFTSSDVEVQVKKAARSGNSYIECPKCAGILRTGRTAVVKDLTHIVNRSERFVDINRAPNRGIDTWVDKAIYGRIVQQTGEYIQQFGIDNPQLKFQRGIRAQKFPGQPRSAKGAEFTVEFMDYNNTRNRIIIQAGVDIDGKLIYPRTFRTLSGTEYPLTVHAIEDLTSGKLYDAAMPDHKIPSLTYRYPDPTRFREISAANKKMNKTAVDDTQLNAAIEGMGVTDPAAIEQVKQVVKQQPNAATTDTGTGTNPPLVTPTNAGSFTADLGVTSGNLNMKSAAMMEMFGDDTLFQAIEAGLAFPEAYEEVRQATRGQRLLTQAEYDQAGSLLVGDVPQATMFADKAAELIKQAEADMIPRLHKTAEMVRAEFNFDNMTADQATQWISSYVAEYNTALDSGCDISTASNKAQAIAVVALTESQVKHALRDKDTYVPIVDPDSGESIATTDEFEAEFDMKYNETDGGILPMEEREYSTMFKGKNAEVDAMQKEAESTGIDLDSKEVGQNPINYSRLKGMVQDYLRAGNIPPTKVDMQKLKDGIYSLEELQSLIDTFKVDRDTFFPTAHAAVDPQIIRKQAEEKLSNLFKQMPLEKEIITSPSRGAEGKAEGAGTPSPVKEEATETEDKLPGGLADGDPLSDFDPEELSMGVEIEKEHTVDKELAEEIAKDHLKEIPDYYTRLRKMEEEAKAEMNQDEVTDTDSLFASLQSNARQDRKAMGMNPEGMDSVCAWCQSVYDDVTGKPIRQLTPEEYATVQSHGMCSACNAIQQAKMDEVRNQRELQRTAKLNLTKTAIDWPWSKSEDLTVPDEGEAVDPTVRIEPPSFLSRKSPQVPEGEPVEATPDQAELMQGLAASKATVDQLRSQVQQAQLELQEKLAPITTQIGEEGQNQLRATKALAALMAELDQRLIQADDQIGYYAEAVKSGKLTPSAQVKILLERFGPKAAQAIAEAQKNLDEISQVTVGKYRQWPAKTSAVDGDDQYLASLYQNAYNTIAGLLDDVQELNFALAA